MQISLRYVLTAVRLLLVGLSLSPSNLAAGYVPRWESTYAPAAVGGSQTAVSGRLLADGSTMIVGDDNGSTTAVRFSVAGTVLSKATFLPPTTVWAYQISPFGEVFVKGNGYVMKYDGVSGAAAWAVAPTFPSGGPVLSAFALDPAGNPITAWDVGTTRYVRKYSYVDGAVLWTNSVAIPSGVASAALTTDSAGNVIVTSRTGGAGNYDFFTTKLSSVDGTALWSATYDRSVDDRPLFVAVDHSDSVFVVGTTYGTGGDIAVVKYNASGVEQWRATHAGPASSADVPTAVAVDANDNLFVAATYVSGSYTDLQFLKYSPSGTKTLNVTRVGTYDDRVFSIAPDGMGDLLYTGSTLGPVGTDLIAGKINGNTGAFTWTKQYDRTTAQKDAGASVAISGSGDALIGGTTTASTNTTDFTFVRYSSSNGTQLAMTHVDGNGAAAYFGRMMAIGAAGQIYAAGDSALQKFDGATGAGLLGSNNTVYTYADLAVAASGDQYELAAQYGSDYALIKRNAAGTPVWSRTYNGGSTDRPVAMTLDGSGNPIVTGTSYSAAAGWAIVTIKYDPAGTQQWLHTFNGTTPTGTDEPIAILTDAAGDVFVAGTATNATTDVIVVKINGATGAEIWSRSIDSSADTAFALALDGSGNPVVTGRYGTSTSADFGAAKLDSATGSVSWNTTVSTAVGDEPHAIAIDGAGDVLLFGTTNITASTGDLLLVKLNGSTGAQLWTATYDGGVGVDNGVAVRIASGDDIVVLGTVMKDSPRFEDLAVIRYSPSGAVASGPVLYDSGRADTASALRLIGDEPVILGRNGSRFLLVRYMESLGIVTRSLPPAFCNVPYAATVEALNGTPPYAWSVTSGVLPSGLFLDPTTGTIAGTPGISGTPFTPRIRVTDATSAFVERDFRIDGFPGAPYVPMIATPNPACGSSTLSVAGSWSSYTWQPNGETTSTITPTFSHPTLFGVSLDDGSCVRRAARMVDVLNPLSAVSITATGATTLCNVATGGTATVTATGGGTNTYQWGYRTTSGGAITDLSGRTGTSYVITTSDFAGAGTFYLVCRTTPACGTPITSNEITLLITTYAAPTGLTANATANNAITVSWTASTGGGVHHYNVYRAADSCTGSFTKIAESVGTTFTDTTVVAGGTYAYKVTAAGSSANVCESGYSNCSSAVAYGNCTMPPSFSGLVWIYPAACKIELRWPSASSSCPLAKDVVYNVYRSTASNFVPAAANRVAKCVPGPNRWEDTNVSPGVTYYYIVRAEDSTTGGGGPCNGGNEDTNLARNSAAAETGYASTRFYRDDFDGLRPPNAAAYWNEIIDSGPTTDQLGLNSCWALYKPEGVTYKFGGLGTCDTPGYLSNSRVRLELGGDGTVDPAINGIVLPSSGTMRLRFRHWYSFESGWDGASLYYRTNAVPARTLVGESASTTAPYIVKGLYTGTASSSGHRVWTGSSDFTDVVVNIPDALHGQTIWFSWRFTSDSVNNYIGYFLDDVILETVTPLACDLAGPLQAFTATSKNGVNKLEWINPASAKYGTTVIRYSYLLGGVATDILLGRFTGAPDTYASFEHTVSNGTTYQYTAWVETTDELVGPRSTTKGQPADSVSRKKWGFNTGATALTPPGVGNGRLLAVSNDRMLYSIKPGASGGDWSNGWRPFQMNGASQARPSVVSMNTNRINGAPRVVFVSSQDGYVYAIDADTGAALWETQIGEMVQGAPSVALREYGIGLTSVDLVIAGTRNSTTPNGVHALNTQGGGIAWSYTGGGTYPIGVIGGQVSIDYPTRRVYFASRAFSSAPNENHTLWCISFDDTSATRVWSIPIGDIDGSPVVRNGTLYVGTNNGTLYAVNPTDGSVLASYATADGPVKGFPFPNSDGRVYFATTNKVWSVIDSLSAPRTLSQGWQYPVLSPSTPVFANNSLYVGSSNGRLRQFTSLTSVFPSVTETYLSLDVVGMQVGMIGFDYQNNLAYVGTAEGVINAVSPQ